MIITIKPRPKSDKITALNVKYNPQCEVLKEKIYEAELVTKNSTKADKFRALLEQTNNEYKQRLGVILNG